MLQEFVKAVEDLVTSMLNEVHTALPAEIISFDPTDCTATVLPKAKMVLTNGQVYDYPPISDVPVMFQQVATGDMGIVFPVQKGDGCLLIISEQTLDTWREEGDVYSELKYALSNAVALPGLFNKPPKDMAEAIEKKCVIVRNKTTKIEIGQSGVKIQGDVEITGTVHAAKFVSSDTN